MCSSSYDGTTLTLTITRSDDLTELHGQLDGEHPDDVGHDGVGGDTRRREG